MTEQSTAKTAIEPASTVWLRLFGRPECVVVGTVVALPTRKATAILALLALEGAVARTRLASLLWPDFDEETARKNVRQELHRLSKTPIKTVLEVSPSQARLSGAVSDVERFRTLAASDPQQALEVYRAPLLDGFDARGLAEFEAWMLEHRDALEAERRAVLVNLTAQLERDGQTRAALGYALELIQLDGLQERFYRDAMRFHAALGEREAALQQFESCRRVLLDELGLEPLPETTLLAEQIRRQRRENIESEDAPGQKPEIPTRTLPSKMLPSKMLPSKMLDVPFVGRDEALERLEAGWRKHQVIVVTGEPGSGKSRLMHEFLVGKGPVLPMHGRPEDQGIAYASFSRFLREWLTLEPVRLEGWMRAELSRLLPELSGGNAVSGGENTQLRLFEAVAEVMRQALRGKVAVFGDDSQFVDAWSAELGRYALGRITAQNPAHRTLSAFRRENMDEATLKPLLELARNDLATVIELEPLSVTEVGQLIGRMSGRPATVFPQRLHQVTLGNPFFLIETLRGLFERGDVRVKDDVWVTAFDDSTVDYHELPIQPTVRAAVLERVDRLGWAARRVLEVGALAGEEHFTLSSASQATALSEFEVLEALEVALKARLIEAHGGGYRFGHDLIARALTDGLSADRARLIHRRLAAHLETTGTQSARVAEHYERGGASLEAARAWAKAAHESHAVFALPDALGCYDRALECWNTMPAHQRATHRSERLERMVNRFWLARQIGVSNDLAAVDAMLELAETSLGRGNALFARAVMLGDAGSHADGLEAAQRAFEQFMTAADLNAAFYALTVCGARARALGRFGLALEFAARELEIAPLVGPFAVVDAHQDRAAAFEESGDHAGALHASHTALQEYEAALASGFKEASGHWLLGARVQHGLAKNLRDLGRLPEALLHANQAVQEAQARGVPRRELEFLLTRARIHELLNRPLEARADLEHALPLARQLRFLEQDVLDRLEHLNA